MADPYAYTPKSSNNTQYEFIQEPGNDLIFKKYRKN